MYLLILPFVYLISCCPQAEQFLSKLPTPHKRLIRPVLERTYNVKLMMLPIFS